MSKHGEPQAGFVVVWGAGVVVMVGGDVGLSVVVGVGVGLSVVVVSVVDVEVAGAVVDVDAAVEVDVAVLVAVVVLVVGTTMPHCEKPLASGMAKRRRPTSVYEQRHSSLQTHAWPPSLPPHSMLLEHGRVFIEPSG